MRKSRDIMAGITTSAYVPTSDGRFGSPLFRLTKYRARERISDGAVVWEAVDRVGRAVSKREVRNSDLHVGGLHGEVVDAVIAVRAVGAESVAYLLCSGFRFALGSGFILGDSRGQKNVG